MVAGVVVLVAVVRAAELPVAEGRVVFEVGETGVAAVSLRVAAEVVVPKVVEPGTSVVSAEAPLGPVVSFVVVVHGGFVEPSVETPDRETGGSTPLQPLKNSAASNPIGNTHFFMVKSSPVIMVTIISCRQKFVYMERHLPNIVERRRGQWRSYAIAAVCWICPDIPM